MYPFGTWPNYTMWNCWCVTARVAAVCLPLSHTTTAAATNETQLCQGCSTNCLRVLVCVLKVWKDLFHCVLLDDIRRSWREWGTHRPERQTGDMDILIVTLFSF